MSTAGCSVCVLPGKKPRTLRELALCSYSRTVVDAKGKSDMRQGRDAPVLILRLRLMAWVPRSLGACNASVLDLFNGCNASRFCTLNACNASASWLWTLATFRLSSCVWYLSTFTPLEFQSSCTTVSRVDIVGAVMEAGDAIFLRLVSKLTSQRSKTRNVEQSCSK